MPLGGWVRVVLRCVLGLLFIVTEGVARALLETLLCVVGACLVTAFAATEDGRLAVVMGFFGVGAGMVGDCRQGLKAQAQMVAWCQSVH